MPNPGIPYDPNTRPQMPARTGSDWTLSQYSVPQPNAPIPAKSYQQGPWVPGPETIAFAEEARPPTRYQQPASTAAVLALVPSPPPPPKPTAPQALGILRDPWTVRDYASNQDTFSALNTAKLAPPNPNLVPALPERYEWSSRDYNAYQPWLGAFFSVTQVSIALAPAPDVIAFAEIPRDMTALRLSNPYAQIIPPSPPSHIPLPRLVVERIPDPLPRDQTPERLVIAQNLATYLAIPIVPPTLDWTFDYEPTDMTPYYAAVAVRSLPPTVQPQIPPPATLYYEPAPWALRDYDAGQDRISAILTGLKVGLPKGLRPYFPYLEALRDIARATPDPNVRIIPPKPPRVIPSVIPQVNPPPWDPLNYRAYQDQFSAFITEIPPVPGFRVMALTAGIYGGVYYLPGDVFDLVQATDFSDGSVNYQLNGNEWATGWMQQVPPGTPLYTSIGQQRPAPFFPPVDPRRRFVM